MRSGFQSSASRRLAGLVAAGAHELEPLVLAGLAVLLPLALPSVDVTVFKSPSVKKLPFVVELGLFGTGSPAHLAPGAALLLGLEELADGFLVLLALGPPARAWVWLGQRHLAPLLRVKRSFRDTL